MSTKKILVLLGTLILAAAVLSACGGGPAGPAGPAGPVGPTGPAGPAGADGKSASAADLTCTECHNDTTLIAGKSGGWEISGHGSGTAYAEEYSNKSCAGCHSGNSFIEMVAAGQNFSQLEKGATDPMRQNCQTCHKIHTTYTSADWELRTAAPVKQVVSGLTFDGGQGNLCATCHQARRYMPNFVDKTDATKYAATIRFNPHLSVQSDVLMGSGGFGVEGKPGAHYSMVKDTCVACHMGGESASHTNEPQLATCVACHADAKDFNVNGAQAKIEERVAELKAALTAKGLLDKEGAPVPGSYDEKTALALWNYGVIEEDASGGLHNPNYVNALIDASLEALK
jgi:hypothetical protein